MKAGRFAWRLVVVVGISLGVAFCARPSKEPSPIEVLLSGLGDGRYRATLVYALSGGASYPLAVVLDPEGGAVLSLLPLSEMAFQTEVLGEMERGPLVRRIEGIEGREFGGQRLQYMAEFSEWGLRPILRFGARIAYLMAVDPHLRFEVRPGASGRVFSLVLRPSARFVLEVNQGM